MGRIKNKNLYPDDLVLTATDSVIGSDMDNTGRTRNYPLGAILDYVQDSIDALSSHATFRVGSNGVNADEDPEKWFENNTITTSLETDLPIRHMKLEVNFPNFDKFTNPVLVIERFRPKRYKSKTERGGAVSKKYRRGDFKKEQFSLEEGYSKANDIPLTAAKQIVDIEANKYFKFFVDTEIDAEFTQVYRKGTSKARRSLKQTKMPTFKAKQYLRLSVQDLTDGVYTKLTPDYIVNLCAIRNKGLSPTSGYLITIELVQEHAHYYLDSSQIDAA